VLIGGVTAVAMLFLGRFLLPPLFAQAARTKSPELFLSACLLVVIVASLVTSAIGFSAVLGALIAGISVDFRVILADWQSLFGALVGVLLVKAAVTALLLRLGGARMAVAAETGVLMASPSETTLIVLG